MSKVTAYRAVSYLLKYAGRDPNWKDALGRSLPKFERAFDFPHEVGPYRSSKSKAEIVDEGEMNRKWGERNRAYDWIAERLEVVIEEALVEPDEIKLVEWEEYK